MAAHPTGASATDFSGVQRAILQPVVGPHAAHLVLEFPDSAAGRQFLVRLEALGVMAFGPRPDRGPKPRAGAGADGSSEASKQKPGEVNLGLTAQGLRMLAMPHAYLSVLGRVSPAFMQGAPVRAASRTGDTGGSAAALWRQGFQQERCHAVLSVHAVEAAGRDSLTLALADMARDCRVTVHVRATGSWLGRPGPEAGPVVRAGVPDTPDDGARRERWLHFGYRDGLSQVAVRGFPALRRASVDPSPEPEHEPGEFLLGHPNDVGTNLALLPTAPQRVRAMLRDGSFGVLRWMEQDVRAFENFVQSRARPGVPPRRPAWTDAQRYAYIKAKLCGRWPDGRHFDPDTGDQPLGPLTEDAITRNFHHGGDPDGVGCPYASHIRRMNPRPDPDARGGVVHARPRVILRRGTPYGAWGGHGERGLLGWFFCARLEDQFEHLLGEWADRMPLGQPGGHASKDPLIGQHETADPPPLPMRGAVPLQSPFEMPWRAPDRHVRPQTLDGMPPFTHTRGMAYAFYPSRESLARIAHLDYDLKDDPEDAST